MTAKKLDHVRLDCISRSDSGLELWWVAKAFSDDSAEPDGMFVNKADAEAHAKELADSLGLQIVVTHFEDKP